MSDDYTRPTPVDLDAVGRRLHHVRNSIAFGPTSRRLAHTDIPQMMAEIAWSRAQIERLKGKLAVVDSLAPANDLVRKLRAETDAANAAHIDALQVDAIEQRQRAEQAEAEIERLRANQLPDGGQWRTEYGHAGGGRTWFDNYACGWPQCNFTRRVWTGPAMPIVSGDVPAQPVAGPGVSP